MAAERPKAQAASAGIDTFMDQLQAFAIMVESCDYALKLTATFHEDSESSPLHGWRPQEGAGRTALPACWMEKMLSCSPAEMKMGGCPCELSARIPPGLLAITFRNSCPLIMPAQQPELSDRTCGRLADLS